MPDREQRTETEDQKAASTTERILLWMAIVAYAVLLSAGLYTGVHLMML